jgi:hypothetical protein
MDKKQLKLELQPLVEQCKTEGIHIEELIIEVIKELEGSRNAPYNLDVCIPTLTVENYMNIRDRVFEIFLNTITKETQRFIFAFSVINCNGIMKNSSVNALELEGELV